MENQTSKVSSQRSSTQGLSISVETRNPGKHVSRTLRKKRQVPAIVYGASIQPTPVTVEEITLIRYGTRRYDASIFQLSSKEKNIDKCSVLLRDIQYHPVNKRPIHADFLAVRMDKTVRVNVELTLQGRPEGLKEGGILEQMLRELDIECLPSEIPENITVDVSHLQVGSVIHVSDINVNPQITVHTQPTMTVATVAVPKEEQTTEESVEGTTADAEGKTSQEGTVKTSASSGDTKKK